MSLTVEISNLINVCESLLQLFIVLYYLFQD